MRLLLLFFTVFFVQTAFSQCAFEILDENFIPSATPTFEQCNGVTGGTDNFTIELYTTVELTSYTIDWGDGSAVVNSTPTPWTVGLDIPHTYTTLGTFTITVTNTLGTCAGEQVIGTVVNQRRPSVNFARDPTSPNEGCVGATVFTFENNSTNVDDSVTFTWDWGDGTTDVVTQVSGAAGSEGGPDITHTYATPVGGVCQPIITLTADFGCDIMTTNTDKTGEVTVRDVDNAAINADILFLCFDTDITLTDLTPSACPADPDARFTQWDFSNLPAPYNVANPVTPAALNSPQVVRLPGGAPGDTYDVELSTTNTCGTTTNMVTLAYVAAPVAAITLPADTICQNKNETFSAATSTGTGPIQYQWRFDGGAYGTLDVANATDTRSFSAVGWHYVELVVNTGNGLLCSDTITDSVFVLGAPIADFTIATTADSCGTREVTFTDNSANGDGTPIASFVWDFDNTNTFNGQVPPVQTYTGADVYNPELVATNVSVGSIACANTFTLPLEVYAIPTVTANIDPACFGVATTFENTSTDIGATSTYTWDFDTLDATVIPTGNIPGAITDTSYEYLTGGGTFTAELIVNTGACIDSADFTVTVFDEVTADFTIDVDSGCTPLAVNFENTSVFPAGVTTFYWEYGSLGPVSDNETAVNFVRPFTNTDTAVRVFPIKILVQAGACADSSFDTVTVYDLPRPLFTSTVPSPQCSPLLVDVANNTDISTGDSLFQWNFGGGSPAVLAINNTSNVSTTFTNTSSTIAYDIIQLIITSPEGCIDSLSQGVSIFPEPSVDILPSSIDGCSPLAIEFTPSEPMFTGTWTFGTGAPPTNTGSGVFPVFSTYFRDTLAITDTTYQIDLNYVSLFGCPGNTNTTITLRRVLDAALNYSIQDSTTTVTVSDASNGEIDDYVYDWNETGVANDTNTTGTQVHDFTLYGAQTISYEVRNAYCSDQVDSFIVIPAFIPTANFDMDTSRGCLPLTVQFTNQTVPDAPDVVYEWDFGDPTPGVSNTSTNRDASHEYTQAGNYIVTLIATNSAGFDIKDTMFIEILTTPRASFLPNVSTVFLPNPVTFVNASSGATNYQWIFGDGSDTVTSASPSHSYQTPGVYNVELIAKQGFCSDTLLLPSAVTAEQGSGKVDVFSGFSPNGDGRNDVFKPEVQGVTNYKFTIFNRWGSLIFSTTDTQVGWDGTLNGTPAPVGVYIYRLETTNPNGRIDITAGEINLLR
ncbi:MAG: PKD domain-containing protein [Cyclobacteriaceae bacterium]